MVQLASSSIPYLKNNQLYLDPLRPNVLLSEQGTEGRKVCIVIRLFNHSAIPVIQNIFASDFDKDDSKKMILSCSPRG